jgi:hypothetical protein
MWEKVLHTQLLSLSLSCSCQSGTWFWFTSNNISPNAYKSFLLLLKSLNQSVTQIIMYKIPVIFRAITFLLLLGITDIPTPTLMPLIYNARWWMDGTGPWRHLPDHYSLFVLLFWSVWPIEGLSSSSFTWEEFLSFLKPVNLSKGRKDFRYLNLNK